ncbi:MAG: hypothetical protein JJU19_11800 [Pararhodobacter sp.]|nr:hypothetical protein [Pararhodobacter sp.]
MQTGNFLYAPRWVKSIALIVLSMALITALAVVVYYIDHGGRETWVLVAISLAQIAASGLVIALIVFFSQRDANLTILRGRIRDFLLHSLPNALQILDGAAEQQAEWQRGRRWIPKAWRRTDPQTKVQITVRYAPGAIEAQYLLRARGRVLNLRAQVNMGEVTFSFYFPAADPAEAEERKHQLEWGFSRLIAVGGYRLDTHFSVESFDNQPYVAFFLTRDYDIDFLDDNRRMLFVVNDLALNLRGLLKDCIERGIPTSYQDGSYTPGGADQP